MTYIYSNFYPKMIPEKNNVGISRITNRAEVFGALRDIAKCAATVRKYKMQETLQASTNVSYVALSLTQYKCALSLKYTIPHNVSTSPSRKVCNQ